MKYLFYLLLLAALAFAIYALLADLPAPRQEMIIEAPATDLR